MLVLVTCMRAVDHFSFPLPNRAMYADSILPRPPCARPSKFCVGSTLQGTSVRRRHVYTPTLAKLKIRAIELYSYHELSCATACICYENTWNFPENMRAGTINKFAWPLYTHCKNKRVVLTQLGYLSCSFTAKECTYKQIS